MNLMTFNKIFGAATAALLVYLLATYVSRTLFELDPPRVLAYGLEIEGAEPDVAADTGDSGEPSLPVLLASADLSAGESQFKKCAACHKLQDGANAVGPHLWGIVGRDVQAVDGFNYSGALAKVADVWDFETLHAYLENPKAYAPGTSMAFAGLRKPADRANLIAYLNEAGGSRLPFPEPVAAVAEAPVEDEPAEDEAVADEAPAEETAVAEAAPAPAEEPAAEEPAAEAAADEAPADTAVAEETPAVVAEAAPTAPAPTPAPAPKPLTFAEALAKPDLDRGAAVFQTCAFCHVLEENRNGIGPSLFGLIDREVASVPFYPYSEAMKAAGGVWSLDRLDAYLRNPATYVPGVKMAYPGVPVAADRAAVLAYIAEVSGMPLAADSAPADAAEAPAAEAVEEAPAAVAEAAPDATVEEEVAPVAEAPVADEPAAEVTAPEAAASEEPAAAEEADVAEAPAEPAPAEEAPAAAEAPAAEAAPEPEQQVAAATPAPAAEPEPAPAASGVDAAFAAAYAAATEKDGQSVFRKCQACHKLAEGQNGVGPSLWGVVGRDKGSAAGFKYSDALMGLGGQWDYEALNAYLENPKAYAPGNRMAFAGLRKVEERAAVIRYLNEQSGSPVPAP